jgi:hypothetical protein
MKVIDLSCLLKPELLLKKVVLLPKKSIAIKSRLCYV